MKRKKAALMFAVLAAAVVQQAQAPLSVDTKFEDQYVRMTILPGWSVDDSSSPPLVKLTHGKYVLTINPIYTHASGIEGGRFGEATTGMPSVQAVMASTEGPWAANCYIAETVIISGTLELPSMYTDETKANVDTGCKFPSDGKSAWFGAYFVGEGSESEYLITLAYNSTDVNALPKKGNPELNRALSDAVSMLKTFELKPPILISSVEPQSATPGATVTLHGSGFYLPNAGLAARFVTMPNVDMAKPKIAADGKSMTFEIPTSRTKITCTQPELVNIGENCVPAPQNYVDDCPRISGQETNFCGVPFPPGVYQIEIAGSGFNVHSNAVSLTVTPPKPKPVFISTLYPNYLILPGDTITVRGRGFTPTGNTVKIGDATVPKIPSPDGESITFEAPVPSGTSFSLYDFKASVANANGESNSITLVYRYTDPNAVRQYRMWQNLQKRNNASSPAKPGH